MNIYNKLCKRERHGLSTHPLHGVWTSMMQRCYYPAAKSYKDYGAVGVVVCDEWKNNFKCFYDWAVSNGWKKGLEIDKDIKGSRKLYSPENCLIVTRKENMNARKSNNRVEYNGQTKTLSEWQDITGIEQGVLWDRIFRYKWSLQRALTTNIITDRKKRIICVNTGEIFSSAKEAAEIKNLLRTSIVSVLSGRRLSTGGLSFKYHN